jgi:hypothetical protein
MGMVKLALLLQLLLPVNNSLTYVHGPWPMGGTGQVQQLLQLILVFIFGLVPQLLLV